MPAQYADRGLWNGGASVIDRQRRVCYWALCAGGRIDRQRRALGAQQQMRAVCHVYSQGTWLNRYLFLFWNGNYHIRKIQYHYNSSHSSEEHASGIFCRHGYSRSKKNAWWSTSGGSVPELQNVADLSLTCRGWVFLWLRRSVIVIFQSKLRRWISK